MSEWMAVGEDGDLHRLMHLTANPNEVAIRFAVRGEAGAIEFTPTWIVGREGTWYAGVEYHWRAPIDIAQRQDCQLLGGGPCSHDGTSLWASEHWLPNFATNGVEWVWCELRRVYDKEIAPGLPEYLRSP